MAFFTASYHQLVWSPNSIGVPKGPFGRVWLSLPHLVYNSVRSLTVWLLVLTKLYISSTPTQSPTHSLEWHVWSSSSGNNCHAVQRSLSSGASVYECTMGFFLPFPISSANFRLRDFNRLLAIWDVSLPSCVSLCNGMFGRVKGQNTTLLHVHKLSAIAFLLHTSIIAENKNIILYFYIRTCSSLLITTQYTIQQLDITEYY